jgi:tetratricopeptide (TPR) repeat protein
LEEEPEIDLVDALPETLEVKSDELDFYSWLDNFSSSEVKNISEQTVNTIPSSDDEPNEEMEELIQLPVDFEEENEPQEAVYNPAAWAEIAYDIQAFVKTSDTAAEKRSEELKPSKYEIDDLLDRFIKKNPSISRTKTEFYKPENMARKSEEFHAEVASESLAKLFFKQGQLHTALEMYEKLLLQNPDKKDIFAARIKSIKEELINRL